MDSEIKHEYHGKQIFFDEKREDWYVNFEGKLQHHKSLQVIKNYIDRKNKKEFTRIPVIIQGDGSYWNRSKEYKKATITSVGVDGTVYVVEDGQKHAHHCGTAYVQNKSNENLIEEIKLLEKKRDDADKKLDQTKRKLKEIDFDKLIKKALGETRE